MFDCYFLKSYDQKMRFGKKVILWHTSLSKRWNLGMPLMRRHTPTMPKEERDVEIFAVANDFDAAKHAM